MHLWIQMWVTTGSWLNNDLDGMYLELKNEYWVWLWRNSEMNFCKNSFSSTEEVLGTLKMGFIKNGLWRSPIEEINRYLSPEEELEFQKFYMKKVRLERRMWLKLFRNCPSLKNMDEPKSQKSQNFFIHKVK